MVSLPGRVNLKRSQKAEIRTIFSLILRVISRKLFRSLVIFTPNRVSSSATENPRFWIIFTSAAVGAIIGIMTDLSKLHFRPDTLPNSFRMDLAARSDSSSRRVRVVLSSARDSFFEVSRLDSHIKKEGGLALSTGNCCALIFLILVSSSSLKIRIWAQKLKVVGDITSP